MRYDLEHVRLLKFEDINDHNNRTIKVYKSQRGKS